MLRRMNRPPGRILMTLDAVGGVWRYALDLARGLKAEGCAVVLAGLGPAPSPSQRQECEAIGKVVWCRTPPDWMTHSEKELDGFPEELEALVDEYDVDLVHLNCPSQACGIGFRCPVAITSHSCVVTWFQAVRGTEVPQDWRWHYSRNRSGLDRADVVISPSAAHAALMQTCYGPIDRMQVVHNATARAPAASSRENFAFAAARWWDAGKNGAVLDDASGDAAWPIYCAGPVEGPNRQRFEFRRACLLGELDNREIRALMARAGIFVSPSRYEPFGLAALEAARSGTPMILADIPTYRELWDGAALFFAADDPTALAGAMNLLAADGPLRRRLGSAAERRARSYSFDQQVRRTLVAYESATQRSLARG
ncbi:glycosyltransferase family 4 protein [Mesorhizobium sp. 1B3]|uniref:glycosyltransferase family 4 protein n=1 Tax=Mesorhizobium sp. 1B3 TaxID=3243599 RepID=UPI003D9663F6